MLDETGKRIAIKDLLDPDVEKPVLEQLYVAYAIPTDQLRREPKALREITGAFNRVTGRDLDENTLLRYMFNRRKEKDWPTLGKKAQKFRPVGKLLDDDQLDILRTIYFDLDITSDEIQYDKGLIRKVAERFHGLSGEHVPGTILLAVILAKRKRREWPRIREDFGDIEQIAGLG